MEPDAKRRIERGSRQPLAEPGQEIAQIGIERIIWARHSKEPLAGVVAKGHTIDRVEHPDPEAVRANPLHCKQVFVQPGCDGIFCGKVPVAMKLYGERPKSIWRRDC